MAKLTDRLTHLLGTNLVGLYVYGSLLDPGFDSIRSDVDCIAVTERALTDAEFHRLDDWLSKAAVADPWVSRLQLSFLIKASALAEDSGACLYQYGILKRSGSDGNPLIWMDFFQRGRVLRGAAPESFLPSITSEMFRQALAREVGYLREALSRKPNSEWRDRPSYPVYAVLTLCRILHSARTGRVASKAQAGRWALDHVPSGWHGLIQQALETGESGGMKELRLPDVCAFVEHTQAQLDSTPPVAPSVGGVSTPKPLADAESEGVD